MTEDQERKLRCEAAHLRDDRKRLNGPMKSWLRKQLIERWSREADPDAVRRVVDEVFP